MGDGAWGMGDRAWGMGMLNGEWDTREKGDRGAKEITLHVQCPMPNAQYPMPNAQCPMP